MTLDQLGHWHWWILTAALIILEVFAPGAFFLWLGLAAAASSDLLICLERFLFEEAALLLAGKEVG